jgi:gas vesicle protein GvpL/GvpF
MIRVYAFVTPLERLPPVAGVGGAALEQHGTDVAAVVSRHMGSGDGDPRLDAVAHGLVVEALTGLASAVLPVRFGETFADEAALDAALEGRRDEIREGLARVNGCVEVGVRVAARERRPPAAVAATGTDYMRARLAELVERDTVVHELHDRLTALARDTAQSDRGGFEASYLVERPRVAEVQGAVEEFAAAHPELTVVGTGPWAPYSFGGAR